MEYLQYIEIVGVNKVILISFKPCYKWNTFNTEENYSNNLEISFVLNLVISGIPSILIRRNKNEKPI